VVSASSRRRARGEDRASSGTRPPLVTFYRLIPGCRAPKRADRAVGGLIPTRAFRYCEALCQASSFGWYLFPPINFALKWDGARDVWWQYDGMDDWQHLESAQFPGFAKYFDDTVPTDIKQYSPPFLVSVPERGIVQVWTGYLARTAPDWSLLIRPVANLARSKSYDQYEGIVETDRWFGPLFTNVQLTRTNVPVNFSTDFPLLQLQPIHRTVYTGDRLNDVKVVDRMEDMRRDDWDCYSQTVVQRMVPTRLLGDYAVAVRKRAKTDSS
jgi:Family of unknown function (DUF6065)